MRENGKTRAPRSNRRRREGSESTQPKRAFVKRGLSRAQRRKYQQIYRREYVKAHGGGTQGKEALRERNRQQRRSSRTVRYLPLLFETADHRYRLWTWQGPSKLFLRAAQEADGMRDLFVPAMRPRVIPYNTDVNHDLRSACKAAAAGIPFQALSEHERRAYAFLLWNECRRYEYLNDVYSDVDPLAEDGTVHLVSQLLVEALTRPLEFVRFLTGEIKAALDDLVQEIQASEFPLDEDDVHDAIRLRFHEMLGAAHDYLAASGLSASQPDSTRYRDWFRRQIRMTERTEPALRDTPDDTPFSTIEDDAAALVALAVPQQADRRSARVRTAGKGKPKRRRKVKGQRKRSKSGRTVKR